MNVTTEQIDMKERISLTRINHLYDQFKTSDDHVRAEKLLDLAQKIFNQEKTIAFCGHFSAGKSSMINHLLGIECLPSSPIPTSANLVKIKSGENKLIKLFYNNGQIETYGGKVQLDELKDFFKDGQLIQKIEIETPSKLPSGAVILDTPGIDSTDDAHRLSTESVLHLADICFYIMDYNHVQAEQNFLFTKKMVENQKPLYIVVNMVDKHQNHELSFQNFKDSVEKAFHNWEIVPQAIYFTSLKDLQHPYNELHLVKKELEILYQKNNNLEIEGSIRMLTKEHLNYVRNQHEDIQYELEKKLSGLDEREKNQLREKYQELYDEKMKLSHLVDESKKKYQNELESILKNAYLMSASTRESAREFLESNQKDFKVGFLFSQRKTQEIKIQRLQAFQDKVQESTDSQLLWHVKELFLKMVREHGLVDPQLEQKIHKLKLVVTEKLILSAVKDGALVNGQAVLQYTNDLAENIKKLTVRTCLPLYEEFKLVLKENTTYELTSIEKQLATCEELLTAKDMLDDLNKKYQNTKERLESILNLEKVEDISDLIHLIMNNHEVTNILHEIKQEIIERPAEGAKDNNKLIDTNHSSHAITEQIELRHQQLVHKLDKSIEVLKRVPNFENLTNQLLERLTKLQNEQFTVALFGAFSAGKSSFANALVGKQLLPVSPNPTTAAICRVVPVPELHENETGKIKLKTEEAVLEDVNEALEPFSSAASNLKEAIQVAKEIVAEKTDTNKRLNQHAFLNAFLRGIEGLKSNLGSQFIVKKQDFQKYVSEEERSLFVESADFFLNSDMTNKGVTLVDTPGADSINARHTDVAFEYIKNADAIIFITYYNHAFSKADREFLIQLGRVKDQFSLDKMFFLVNASDLAKDESELGLVLNYVGDQLRQYGINRPKLYPISALKALRESLNEKKTDKRWLEFETEFYKFIKADLRLTAIKGAEHELEVAVNRVERLIIAASQNKEEREKQKQVLSKEKALLNELFHASIEQNLLETQLKQEVEELIYYLNQRIYIRYSDFFKEAFNPTTVKGSGNLLKGSLSNSLKELLISLGFDISQELRATSLRIENYINKLLDENFNKSLKQIQDINNQLSFSEIMKEEMTTPGFTNRLKELPISSFKSSLNKVGSTKALFEKDGKKRLAADLRQQLEPFISEYLSNEQEKLFSHYLHEGRRQFELQMSSIRSEVEEQYNGLESILDDHIDLQELKYQYRRLNKILERKEDL